MIPLNESSNLEFSLSIQNSTSKLDKATLFIEGGTFDIVLPILLEDDKAKVAVPILEKILEPGTYNMRLEMVLGGVLYTPFKDQLIFHAPPSIKVESAAVSVAPSFVVTPKMSIQPVVEEKPAVAAPVAVVEEAKPATSATSKHTEEFAKLLQSAFEATKKS